MCNLRSVGTASDRSGGGRNFGAILTGGLNRRRRRLGTMPSEDSSSLAISGWTAGLLEAALTVPGALERGVINGIRHSSP